jgi:hypothetical protein
MTTSGKRERCVGRMQSADASPKSDGLAISHDEVADCAYPGIPRPSLVALADCIGRTTLLIPAELAVRLGTYPSRLQPNLFKVGFG